MIDDARLKAIEAAIPPAIEDPGGDDFSLAVNTIHELIDALRHAWRERDKNREYEQNCADLLRVATGEALRYKRERDNARNDALETAARIADAHTPEYGHVHTAGAVSCQMTIGIE